MYRHRHRNDDDDETDDGDDELRTDSDKKSKYTGGERNWMSEHECDGYDSVEDNDGDDEQQAQEEHFSGLAEVVEDESPSISVILLF